MHIHQRRIRSRLCKMNRNDEKESGNQNVNSKKYATVVGKPSGHLRGAEKIFAQGRDRDEICNYLLFLYRKNEGTG